jgi:hypothetical protein
MTEKKLADWHDIVVAYKSNFGEGTYTEQLDLYGGCSFDDIRNQLDRIQESYGDHFDSFRIDTRRELLFGDSDPTTRYVAQGWREETDEEFAARIDLDKQRREAAEARERAEYERLAKKFDDK